MPESIRGTWSDAIRWNVRISGDGTHLLGAGKPGLLVKLMGKDGVSLCEGTIPAHAEFTFPLKSAQTNGETLHFTVEPPEGQSFYSHDITAPDFTPPPPVQNLSIDGDWIIGDGAEPGQSVRAIMGKKIVADAIADEKGGFALALPSEFEPAKITVHAYDAMNNRSDAASLDVTPPDLTGIHVSPDGWSVYGATEPRATVTACRRADCAEDEVLGSAEADEQGRVFFEMDEQLRNGETVYLEATDMACNVSEDKRMAHDSQAPLFHGEPEYYPEDNTVRGKAEAGVFVEVFVARDLVGINTADDDGNFRVEISEKLTQAQQLTVVIFDTSENPSKKYLSVRLDETADAGETGVNDVATDDTKNAAGDVDQAPLTNVPVNEPAATEEAGDGKNEVEGRVVNDATDASAEGGTNTAGDVDAVLAGNIIEHILPTGNAPSVDPVPEEATKEVPADNLGTGKEATDGQDTPIVAESVIAADGETNAAEAVEEATPVTVAPILPTDGTPSSNSASSEEVAEETSGNEPVVGKEAADRQDTPTVAESINAADGETNAYEAVKEATPDATARILPTDDTPSSDATPSEVVAEETPGNEPGAGKEATDGQDTPAAAESVIAADGETNADEAVKEATPDTTAWILPTDDTPSSDATPSEVVAEETSGNEPVAGEEATDRQDTPTVAESDHAADVRAEDGASVEYHDIVVEAVPIATFTAMATEPSFKPEVLATYNPYSSEEIKLSDDFLQGGVETVVDEGAETPVLDESAGETEAFVNFTSGILDAFSPDDLMPALEDIPPFLH